MRTTDVAPTTVATGDEADVVRHRQDKDQPSPGPPGDVPLSRGLGVFGETPNAAFQRHRQLRLLARRCPSSLVLEQSEAGTASTARLFASRCESPVATSGLESSDFAVLRRRAVLHALAQRRYRDLNELGREDRDVSSRASRVPTAAPWFADHNASCLA
jgi:hypothetical protein